jgi:hypothetical protein
MNGRLSHTEAQRFLSAIVAEEIVRLEAERYEEPLDQSAAEWLDRVSTERARRAAAEIVSARGTSAILLTEDEARLSTEGFSAAEIAGVSEFLGPMRERLSCRDADDEISRAAEGILGRGPTDARQSRLLRQLNLPAQARALEKMDRVKAALLHDALGGRTFSLPV